MHSRSTRASGMALLMVLWIVAALSLIITGVIHSVRNEIKVASGMQDSVVGDAFGLAVINLTLQRMMLRPDEVKGLMNVSVPYQGLTVDVEVQPLNGLIDINRAEAPLLTALFSVAGGLPGDAAARLAASMIQYRQERDARGAQRGFEAIEDLLQVPGVSYPLYARLSALVTADLRGSGRVNPMAARPDVLLVLTNGDSSRARQMAATRATGGPMAVDASSLNTALVDTSTIRKYRLTARVPLMGGGWLISSRTVDMAGGAKFGLPWRTLGANRYLEQRPGNG